MNAFLDLGAVGATRLGAVTITLPSTRRRLCKAKLKCLWYHLVLVVLGILAAL